jgi:exodeoxyribonuclease-3
MNIVSWNVNGLRALVKKGQFEWLVNQQFDIFCLQETKSHPEQLDEIVKNPAGYFSYFDHSKLKKGYSGVAIYSKVKPEKVEYGLGIPEYDQEGRLLVAYYKDFVLLNGYFPNGGGGPKRLDFKLRFYDKFFEFIEKLRKNNKKVIFCGDINTAHTAIDLARPKENENNTGFLPIERAWLDKVVSNGYVDTFRNLHPDKKESYTYWDMKTFARDRNVGWRIDYFFVSSTLVKKIKDAKIFDSILGSDHCPVSLVLFI